MTKEERLLLKEIKLAIKPNKNLYLIHPVSSRDNTPRAYNFNAEGIFLLLKYLPKDILKSSIKTFK